jgi:hypothetical protein
MMRRSGAFLSLSLAAWGFAAGCGSSVTTNAGGDAGSGNEAAASSSGGSQSSGGSGSGGASGSSSGSGSSGGSGSSSGDGGTSSADSGDSSVCGTIPASDYNQTCSQDSDCAGVQSGTICSTQCACGNDAINASDLTRYWANFPVMTPACPCSLPRVYCNGTKCVRGVRPLDAGGGG